MQWVFARGGELGLCAEVSPCPLCGGRAVRDARMRGIENLSGGSARLKAVPRRPTWVWGQRAVPEREEAGSASPAQHALGVQSLLGNPAVRSRAGARAAGGAAGETWERTVWAGPAVCPRQLCEWGAPGLRRAVRCPHWPVLLSGRRLFPGSLLALGRGSGWLRIGPAH